MATPPFYNCPQPTEPLAYRGEGDTMRISRVWWRYLQNLYETTGKGSGVPAVTSVATGNGLSGGPITSTGTLTANIGAGLAFAAGATTVSLGSFTNSLAGDVALNNVANYFDGPSVAQGTTGTWFASGSIDVTDTAGAAAILAKLWDGTTVISSGAVSITGAGVGCQISLSGIIAAPAGNIRISAKDISSTSGLIKFNNSTNSKDATLTAFRIA